MPSLGMAPGAGSHGNQVNVRLTDDVLDRLKEIASTDGVAMAQVIRRSIESEIARVDKRVKRSGKAAG